MMHLSREEFTASISEAGALGILASAIYREKASFRQAIKDIKSVRDIIAEILEEASEARNRLNNL